MADLSALKVGLAGTAELVVGPEHTAPRVGSGMVAVLATPVMINLIEAAALAAAERRPPAGHQSLGIHLDVRHFAATPVGMRVTASAEVTAIDGAPSPSRSRRATRRSRSGRHAPARGGQRRPLRRARAAQAGAAGLRRPVDFLSIGARTDFQPLIRIAGSVPAAIMLKPYFRYCFVQAASVGMKPRPSSALLRAAATMRLIAFTYFGWSNSAGCRGNWSGRNGLPTARRCPGPRRSPRHSPPRARSRSGR